MLTDDSYTLLTDEALPYKQGSRTTSAAMLAWFLTAAALLRPRKEVTVLS